MTTPRKEQQFEYDVCLSFAGEDRAYVRKAAAALEAHGTRVFYDDYAEVELWGKDLYVHLDHVYREAARYCVLFASKHYEKKVWTNHERASAQARALQENREYILPARFDKTKIPGLPDTVGFIDLSKRSPDELASMILRKLGPRQRANYFPPVPDRLFRALGIRRARERKVALDHARCFRNTLDRMSEQEHLAVFAAFRHGCPAELPANVHINIDLLRRYTGIAPARLKTILGGLSSLGFSTRLREDDENDDALGQTKMLVLRWSNLSDTEFDDELTSTLVVSKMIELATGGLCHECGQAALTRLDFGQLSRATSEADSHPRR
jgi:hypothetical protein